MLRELWQFCKAGFARWEPFAFGGVTTLLILGYEKVTGMQGLPGVLLWAGIPVTIFVACFLAWRDERRDAETARAQRDEISRPRLSIELHEYNAGTLPDGMTGITVLAKVRNTGAPSIAENYKLKVIRPDGKKFSPDLWHFPGGVTLHSRIGTLRKFDEDDYLMVKTFDKPIDRNSQTSGILTFQIQAKPEEVFVVGSDLVLTCTDIFAKIATVTFHLGEEATRHRFLPGMKGRFIHEEENSDQQRSQSLPATKRDP